MTQKLPAKLIAVLASLPFSLIAANITWSSTSSNDWHTAANWNSGAGPVPGVGDTAIFPNPTPMGLVQTITFTTTATVGSLEFNGGAYTIFGTGMGAFFNFNNGSQDSTITISSSTTGSQTLTTNSGSLICYQIENSLDIENNSSFPLITTDITNVALSENISLTAGDWNTSGGSCTILTLQEGTTFGPTGNFFGVQGFSVEGLAGNGTLVISDSMGNNLSPFFTNTSTSTHATFSGTILSSAPSGISLNIESPQTFTSAIVNMTSGTSLIVIDMLTIDSTVSFPNIPNLQIQGATQFDSPIGTLHIAGPASFSYEGGIDLPSFPTSVVSISTISVDSGVVFTVSGAITDVNMDGTAFEKAGSGTLVLNGTCTYGGPTMVSAGRLNVIGSTASSDTTVFSGATLGGTGTLHGAVLVESGGFLTPGTSVGTLTVNSLTLDAGSVTQIEITPSIASKVVVTSATPGSTILAGSVQVIVDAGSYPTTGSDTILTSTSAYTGSFSPTVTSNNPIFTFTLDQTNPHQVLLNWIKSTPPPPAFLKIPTVGLKGNAHKFANYLNRNVPDSSATQALAHLSGEVLEQALESADPARNAFAPFAIQNTLFSLSDLVTGHLVEQRFYYAPKTYGPIADARQLDEDFFTASNATVCPPKPCRPSHSVWFGAVGDYAHQKGLDQNPAFHFLSGGALIGVDFYNDRNLFGFSGGAAYTHLIQNENGGSAKINYYFANLYDTCYSSSPCRPFYVEWAVWGVYNQIHNYRNISFPGFQGTASATFHSWELAPHLGFGYQASYCNFEWEPFALFDLVIDWQQGFREHGVGAFDMTHESRTSFFLRSEGGLRLYKMKQFDWGSWITIAKGSYVNKKAFGTGSIGASIVGTSALFSVETFRGVQNLGSFGLEMVWRRGFVNPVSFTLAYNGEWGTQYWSQEGMIRLAKDF